MLPPPDNCATLFTKGYLLEVQGETQAGVYLASLAAALWEDTNQANQQKIQSAYVTQIKEVEACT